MRYKTVFRLSLKAIGVLLAVQAIPSLVMNFTQLTLALINYSAPGTSLWSVWHLPSAIGYLIQLGLGIYCFFGGQWIVDRAIPSNRVYCDECAYELRGLPNEGACPECGTPYRLPAPTSREVAP